ncbi:hypothetical protein ACFTWF_39010 [Rhodococcus sp. NPDC056960]|jgi:hypothetical protein|uniref:hypothetical protein n=1 Tax=Rhodococcus sp. NPDC056960 TaxID=3345982 RepID=UPI0036328D3F
MYVTVAPDGRTATLHEADDCTRLHVAAPAGWDDAQVRAVLQHTEAGTVEDHTAWLSVDWLQNAAQNGRLGAQWRGDFAAMIDFARSRGWVSPDATAVRAHLEFG